MLQHATHPEVYWCACRAHASEGWGHASGGPRQTSLTARYCRLDSRRCSSSSRMRAVKICPQAASTTLYAHMNMKQVTPTLESPALWSCVALEAYSMQLERMHARHVYTHARHVHMHARHTHVCTPSSFFALPAHEPCSLP